MIRTLKGNQNLVSFTQIHPMAIHVSSAVPCVPYLDTVVATHSALCVRSAAKEPPVDFRAPPYEPHMGPARVYSEACAPKKPTLCLFRTRAQFLLLL